MSTVLVTGANRGIGLELCRRLQARGDEVIAVCRQPSAELQALDVRIEEGVDVSELHDLEALAGRLQGARVDILINNAGVLQRQALGEIDADAVEAMLLQLRVNSIGPVLVTQALAGNLAAGSKVIIITSRMGSIADNTSGGSYGYRMSKAAVNIAGVSLAHDLRPRGIAVALLHPGYVRTEMTGHTGMVEADEAAAGLLVRIAELDLEMSGSFRHANGEPLPW